MLASASSLDFTTNTWDQWQDVTFAAATDADDVDGWRQFTFASSFGGDPSYCITHEIDVDSNSDTDGDGMLDWQEFIAGTDSTNSASLLSITNCLYVSSDIIIEWSSVSGKVYSLRANTNLLSSDWWQVGGLVTGTPPANAVTVTPSSAECEFYRIRVEQGPTDLPGLRSPERSRGGEGG